MTLISTVISQLGIIQMSDSFVTYRDGSTKEKPKVWATPNELGGAIAVAGCYMVGGEELDTWMPMIIEDFAAVPSPRSLESFARYLGRLLDVNATEDDRNEGYLIHVAGYGDDESNSPKPEMWFVRNIEHMSDEGEYYGRTATFNVTEEISVHYADSLRDATNVTIPAQFMNGFTPGRVAFNRFGPNIFRVFRDIWDYPSFDFDPPSTLDELSKVFELQMKAVCVLASMSHYEAPYIGEPIQMFCIDVPADI